jgi:hypothetical protein
MFEILVGAKMFKLSFSGSSMTIVDMQNNIKVSQPRANDTYTSDLADTYNS